jgi:hypothetical protein
MQTFLPYSISKKPSENPTGRGAAALAVGWLLLLVCALVLNGCSDRQRRNPLDPQGVDPLDNFDALEVLAGDQSVLLRWDFSVFEDVEGFLIYRQTDNNPFSPLPVGRLTPQTQTYTDSSVENGTTYAYRLALVITGEGEDVLDQQTRLATPGPEVGWVGDVSTGLVWQISADGRGGRFAQGRFPGLQDIAINRADGSCWVSDRFLQGLFRILADGELETYTGAIGEAGALSLDAAANIGWIIDNQEHTVYWFETAAPMDTLSFVEVDARFIEPSSVAAQAGQCWIVDGKDGRVFLYQREGRRSVEFRGLLDPGPLAAGLEGSAWALLDQGNALIRLDVDGTQLAVELPFEAALDLDVDLQTGDCWVVGASDLAVFNDAGMLVLHRQDIPSGRDVAVDEINRWIWLSTSNVLWKLDVAGQPQARLEGFSSAARVAVNPGTP